ncbi:hypothetical protein, partial [Paenibacillus ginsengarvi]|uniref:hypothetical protein n=1 Tax=Paenibacillus ginsengarvi TaxID=400777 RepID=UPI0019608E52
YAKMGVAHVGFSCEKWCCGDFHFTRIHSWASLFLAVALHITIRHKSPKHDEIFFCYDGEELIQSIVEVNDAIHQTG